MNMFSITDRDLIAINRYQAFSTKGYIKDAKVEEGNLIDFLDKPSIILENYGTF